jgi:transcription antitermination factor NusG
MIAVRTQLESSTRGESVGGLRVGPATTTPSTPIETYSGEWCVVHVKSRQEKALSRALERMDVAHFLPLAHIHRRYKSRTKLVSIPLFPGYVFVCGGPEDRTATLATHRAARIIQVGDQGRLAADLREIYRATTSGVPVDLYAGIRRGCRCRVRSGPLEGLEGVVLRRRGRCRVYVAVEVLGQSAEVELDPALLEIIE